MTDKLAFLLFGDQSSDTHGFLAEFFRQPERGILANAFLEQVGRALRKEIEALSRVERSKLPKFLSLQHLNERYHAQGLKHPGIDGALLCISQLAHYIEYVTKGNLGMFETNCEIAMLKSTMKMSYNTRKHSLWAFAQGCLPQLPSLRRQPSPHWFPSPSRLC